MTGKRPTGVAANGRRTPAVRVARELVQRRIEQRTEHLQRSNEALRILLLRLLAFQDDERRRLGRDLGESVAQILACVGMNLSMVQGAAQDLKPAALRALAESAELVEKCATEILTLSYDLHPPLLDHLGLVPALRWYAEGFSSRTGIAVDLEAPHELGRLTPEVKTALFRIVQESLTSMDRHNTFGAVRVRLARSHDAVTLCIVDLTARAANVRAPAAVRKARNLHTIVGILSMRERVRALGGKLVIDTGVTGTIVRTRLPASGKAAHDGGGELAVS